MMIKLVFWYGFDLKHERGFYNYPQGLLDNLIRFRDDPQEEYYYVSASPGEFGMIAYGDGEYYGLGYCIADNLDLYSTSTVSHIGCPPEYKKRLQIFEKYLPLREPTFHIAGLIL